MSGAPVENESGNVAAEAPDYTGPAILSRGSVLSRPALPVNQNLRFYAGLDATYNSGLIGAYVQNGQFPAVSSTGLSLTWGASMLKYRRKDILQFSYAGNLYENFSSAHTSGLNHSFSGGITHQFNQRFAFALHETAGLTTDTYSVLNSTALADTGLTNNTAAVAPNTEAFDNRTYFSTTNASLTYQKSVRLSFSINGSYFLVNRDSANLANTRGYAAGGNIAYRISKRQTLGIYYSHSESSAKKVFGDSNADSAGFNYSTVLSRSLNLSLQAGATRYDQQFLSFVVPNPLVQQILGIRIGIEKFYIVGYTPDVAASLRKQFRNSSVTANFSESISPGNGLILSSKSQSEAFAWVLPTFRTWASQFGVGRDTLVSYAANAGNYKSYYARYSLTRPITSTISSYMNFDLRKFGFTSTTFGENEYQVSLGFRFSPGQGPIKFW
jgi:hypothetical protein